MEVVTLRMSPEDVELVTAAAAIRGTSRSALLRKAAREAARRELERESGEADGEDRGG